MKYLRTEDGNHFYQFICEGCRSEGELGVPADLIYQQIRCPEGCGARYIQWHNPITEKPDLMCVVCPVFDWLPLRGG
jgi:hypothetical protein